MPITSRNTPYALQKLLEMYKNQFLDAVETMKSPAYRKQLLEQVEVEKRRKEELNIRKDQLDKHIDRLIADSTKLLRSKLEELNIQGEGATADTLLSEVSKITFEFFLVKKYRCQVNIFVFSFCIGSKYSYAPQGNSSGSHSTTK